MSLTQHLLDSLHMSEDQMATYLFTDVQEVFSTMVGMEELLHLPMIIDLESHFIDCVTAMVGFAGTYNGLVSLHAPKELALSFTSNMLGMEVSEVDDDVRDALGEITNMIAGSFKSHLSRGGADIKLSTPSVVNGNDYFVHSGSSMESISLRFATDASWFIVCIALKE